jgi:hypothetical protein
LLLKSSHRLRYSLCIARAQGNMPAFLCKGLHNRQTNAARSASYQYSLSFQTKFHAREAQIKSKLASVFTRDEFHMNFFTSSI